MAKFDPEMDPVQVEDVELLEDGGIRIILPNDASDIDLEQVRGLMEFCAPPRVHHLIRVERVGINASA